MFGGVALEGELQAFKSGLLKEPVLEDDFGRRGARVAVVRDGARSTSWTTPWGERWVPGEM